MPVPYVPHVPIVPVVHHNSGSVNATATNIDPIVGVSIIAFLGLLLIILVIVMSIMFPKNG